MNLLDAIARFFSLPQRPSDHVLRAIEITGQLIGPMLQAAPGYPERLAESTSRALDYCAELARAIPGPVEVSRRAFGSDPFVHALFGRSADIEEMLGRSHALREFLQVNIASAHFYALLGMRQREKRQLGMALEGDAVRAEVAQTILYFRDHTLTDPAPRLDDAREKLRTSMFRGLVETYALHVRELLDERERTKVALALERARAGQHATAAQEIPHTAHSRRLHELSAALRIHASELSPARLLDQLAACFSAPHPLLHLDSAEVAIDRLGIVADSRAARNLADTLRFVTLTSRDRRQWVVVIACIERDEALEAMREVERATRYIII